MQIKHDLYLCVSGALSCCAMAAFTMYVGAQKDKAPATNATHVKPSVENIKLLLKSERKTFKELQKDRIFTVNRRPTFLEGIQCHDVANP